MQDCLFFLKKYKKELVFSFFICLCLFLSCYTIFISQDIEDESTQDLLVSQEEEEIKEEIPSKQYVDIKGAVLSPGVYEVEEGTIINDVINLAGGFTEDADQNGINLSKKVEDEMVIYIYTKKEISSNDSTKNTSNSHTSCTSTSYNINDCVEKTESIITNKESNEKEETEKSGIVNINTASQSELMTLSGIGDTKAKAIIDYRNTNGAFKKIEDLLNVNGIGDAIFEKIKDYITI